jgi:hypothetical protein
MVRIIFAGLAATGAACAVALAQVSPPPPASEESADAEPVSELDRLSRSTDNPFPTSAETGNRKPVSVTLRALDKITARYTDLETPIETPVKFGSLEILPHFCDKRPPEEFPETTAFLEIFDRDLARARAEAASRPSLGGAPEEAQKEDPALSEIPIEITMAAGGEGAYPVDVAVSEGEGKPADPDRIFSGWMFASSPALNSMEHPVYDVWVIDCKTETIDN